MASGMQPSPHERRRPLSTEGGQIPRGAQPRRRIGRPGGLETREQGSLVYRHQWCRPSRQSRTAKSRPAAKIPTPSRRTPCTASVVARRACGILHEKFVRRGPASYRPAKHAPFIIVSWLSFSFRSFPSARPQWFASFSMTVISFWPVSAISFI
jgi:hypothetical protein